MRGPLQLSGLFEGVPARRTRGFFHPAGVRWPRNGKRWTPLEHAVDDNALLLPTDLPVMQSSKFELFSSTGVPGFLRAPKNIMDEQRAFGPRAAVRGSRLW
jgi:hypothetical protein